MSETRGSLGPKARIDEIMPMVYDRLRRVARQHLRRERGPHSLAPTALVHEVYLRMQRAGEVHWESKTHFVAMASILMRRILVEHARAARAAKRGGGRHPRTLIEYPEVRHAGEAVELLDLDAALDRLEGISKRAARVAEFRIFGGLEFSEMAIALSVSERTAKRDWTVARAWLARELRRGTGKDR